MEVVEAMKVKKMREVLEMCVFPGYELEINVSTTTGAIYLQAHYDDFDTTTNAVERQHTRRWSLSPEMTRSEIVGTAFKCIITSMEHKTREWFTYRGRAIYQPHHDVDVLHSVCEARDARD